MVKELVKKCLIYFTQYELCEVVLYNQVDNPRKRSRYAVKSTSQKTKRSLEHIAESVPGERVSRWHRGEVVFGGSYSRGEEKRNGYAGMRTISPWQVIEPAQIDKIEHMC